MSYKNETELYGDIHKALKLACIKRNIPTQKLHFTRVESPITSGVPDINVKITGYEEFWIEAKIYPNLLSPFQRGWFHKRAEAGGFVCAIAYSNEEQVYMMLIPVPVISKTLDEIITYILDQLLCEGRTLA